MKLKSLHLVLFYILLLLVDHVNGFGSSSSSTIAVIYGTSTVCGIGASTSTQSIQCYKNGRTFSIQPNISFQSISGGYSFFCALRSGGLTVICWHTNTSIFQPRRIYSSDLIRLTDLSVGDDHVCAREMNSGIAKCWRGRGKGGGRSVFPSPGVDFKFSTITSGDGFTCGILKKNGNVHCWGNDDDNISDEIQTQFGNLEMVSLVSGKSHVCGLTNNGSLICKGRNESGQLDVPCSSPFEFSGFALGSDFSCAIKEKNGLVKCWGKGANKFQLNSNVTENVPFDMIASGFNFTCGLTTRNLSIACWGLGWTNVVNYGNDVPLGMIIPGPCIQSTCSECGLYPNSEVLCGGSGNICKSCLIELPFAVPLPPRFAPPSPQSWTKSKYSVAFVVVGSVGCFAGICALVYCFYSLLKRRNQNVVQASTVDPNQNAPPVISYVSATPSLISFSARRHSSRRLVTSSGRLGRQRSESSSKLMEKIQNFTLEELIIATNNFSVHNKIGAGSFGSVYNGVLSDGRVVAIKRGESVGMKMKKFQEKESAFDSELVLLSRLHHKHLVDLIGFCEEMEERLLVYEFMSNGSLYDHLHSKNNVEKSSSILNSWKMRIKIALDAARGIEYLHNYAVPPIIHRDIKSSNILLDANWVAKVSDFGLSLMGPESDKEFMSMKAVGTVGYIDPEYYVLNVLTAKSDVYGIGVVLLELLTGKKAVFKTDEDGTIPIGVVEYAVPLISTGRWQDVLDKRIGIPAMHEAEAVELMAYTAVHSVNLEGKERPSIVDIVANLERALALCEGSPAFTYSIPSD